MGINLFVSPLSLKSTRMCYHYYNHSNTVFEDTGMNLEASQIPLIEFIFLPAELKEGWLKCLSGKR